MSSGDPQIRAATYKNKSASARNACDRHAGMTAHKRYGGGGLTDTPGAVLAQTECDIALMEIPSSFIAAGRWPRDFQRRRRTKPNINGHRRQSLQGAQSP